MRLASLSLAKPSGSLTREFFAFIILQVIAWWVHYFWAFFPTHTAQAGYSQSLHRPELGTLPLCFTLKSFVCCSKWHCVQGCQPLLFGVAVLAAVADAAAPASSLAVVLELAGCALCPVLCSSRQPSQVQSLNFILLTMAASGLGVTRHTQQGG